VVSGEVGCGPSEPEHITELRGCAEQQDVELRVCFSLSRETARSAPHGTHVPLLLPVLPPSKHFVPGPPSNHDAHPAPHSDETFLTGAKDGTDGWSAASESQQP